MKTCSSPSQIKCCAILAILFVATILIGCDGQQTHVEEALKELHSLDDMTRNLEGSSTRAEYYRLLEDKKGKINSAIEKIRDEDVKESLNKALRGYVLTAEYWDPKNRSDAANLALARTVTHIALPWAYSYARSSASERQTLKDNLAARNDEYKRSNEVPKPPEKTEAEIEKEAKIEEQRTENNREYWRKKNADIAERAKRDEEKEKQQLAVILERDRKIEDVQRKHFLEREAFKAKCVPGVVVYNISEFKLDTDALFAVIPQNSPLRIIEKKSNDVLHVSFTPLHSNRDIDFDIEFSLVQAQSQ